MALARCVSETMQNDSTWGISSLIYQVTVYSDIERSVVKAHVAGMAGEVFQMEINKVGKDTSSVIIKGLEHEGGKALKALEGCADK